MRIISGELGGRKIKSPATYDVRPTSDKVKEAIFSMLIPFMHEDFIAVDLFAGSGNMGIEAISRGAKTVYFSDNSRQSLALVKENLEICRVADRGILLSGDYKLNIRRVREKADIFFLDPPYADKFILPALDIIAEEDNLNSGGVVVCEHSHKDVLPEEYGPFTAIKDRRYGAIGVTVYQYNKEQA